MASVVTMAKRKLKKSRKEPALAKRSDESPGQLGKSAETKPGSVLREDCFRILNEDNTIDPKRDPKFGKELLVSMYRNMVLTRIFDERGMMLQRQGRIGFYVPSFGQEAIQTGTAAALKESDWVFPSYREPGIFLYRGVTLYKMLCNLWGNQDDTAKGRQMPVHYSFPEQRLFSVSSPIATQVVQAVGAAMAFKLRGEKGVAITYCGDGGTSENDFHTGLTFAGAYKAPTIFIVTNNQYAISCPISKQTGAKRFADKAIGYGMPGVAVDGNDLLAVYQVTRDAVDRARKGEGPCLIECVTLRMGPHSSSDDPTRYRDERLYEAWKKRDPILRTKQYLVRQKLWDEAKDSELQEAIKRELAESVERAEKASPPELDDLFTDVYADLTPQLRQQRDALLRERELRGKFENTSEAFPL
jgi:2-oxoisovalerate dehydrogenase E1 component alpha subunit